MARTLLSAACLALAAAPATADVKIPFIGAAVYATKEGCEKLKALAAGGEKNVATVPEFLTEDRFGGWEGGCTFASLTETQAGRAWEVQKTCFEGEDETQTTDIFELDVTTKAIAVTEKGQTAPTVFLPCDAPAPIFD